MRTNPIPRRRSRRLYAWSFAPMVALLALALALAGCSSTAGTTTGGGGSTSTGGHTATATPTANVGDGVGSGTATPSVPAPAHAFAWYQIDGSQVPQIWASLNGGASQQITHVAADHADCDDQVAWGLPVFSPDLTHIVSSLGSYNCGDGGLSGQISIVNVSSGSVTPVGAAGANTSIQLPERADGWLDNSTIWYVNYAGLFTYALGASTPTLVTPLNQPFDAVLRGSTLFWTEFATTSGSGGSVTLHRYDISSHSDLGTSISLGSTTNCHCSPGGVMVPGWDASPDGSHIAYQVVSPSSSGNLNDVGSSHFYYANADGSGASQIASYVTTNHIARLLISPNGQLVAISSALPSPSVITASVSSPGHNGDPNLHFYSPDGVSFPVWKWDSATFWAAHAEPGNGTGNGATPNIEHYNVGAGSGSLGVAGGYNPWYTIGS
ncbi:MAG TPA: hypothetical protein VMV29_14445 [Ktedonobacterales bacterium]|nr:hypothetical protein [Ktedonobacterales bacterium]